MLKKVILPALFMISFGGCAHTHVIEGPENKSENPAGIRVEIGSPEVKAGDRVRIVKTECGNYFLGGRNAGKRTCRLRKIGEALVVRVLDRDTAIIEPQAGTKIEAGMTVESVED